MGEVIDEYIGPLGSLVGMEYHGGGTVMVLVMSLLLVLAMLLLMMGMVGLVLVNLLGCNWSWLRYPQRDCTV